MLRLYGCILSIVIVFLELLENLFALYMELTKTGLVHVLF